MNKLRQKIKQLHPQQSLDDFINQCQKKDELLPIIESLPEEEKLKELDNNLEINYPDGKTLITLKSDAKALLDYLENGKRLEGIGFILRRLLLPNEKYKKNFILLKKLRLMAVIVIVLKSLSRL